MRICFPRKSAQLDGFREILVNFYQEARLDQVWAQFQPGYEQASTRYSIPLRRIVTTSNGYLREILKPSSGRTFTLYMEPLVGTRTILRNSGDQYTIVIGLNVDIPEDEIQHAYLHYILDPVVLQHRKEVETKSALLNIAAHAPGLPIEYHDDFLSFADECLIQAVQLRLNNLSSAKLEAALQNADESGFILVRPMVQQLKKFEAGGPSMTYYFPDLINGIDVQAETQRLQNFTFSAAASVSVPELAHTPATVGASELYVWLAEGDRDIASQNVKAAQETFEKVLAKYPNQPRATYGLAIASVMSGNADRAEDLFGSLVSKSDSSAAANAAPAVDPSIVSWSYVYLGRIHDLEDDRGAAMSNYSAALHVGGAPEAARVAAQNGLNAPYLPPTHNTSDKSSSKQPRSGPFYQGRVRRHPNRERNEDLKIRNGSRFLGIASVAVLPLATIAQAQGGSQRQHVFPAAVGSSIKLNDTNYAARYDSGSSGSPSGKSEGASRLQSLLRCRCR